jgi:hypothetical protein
MKARRSASFLALALSAACATPAEPRPDASTAPYDVAYGPEEVTLVVLDGGAIPLPEFVKIAQRATGRVITYRDLEVREADAPVRFVGTLRIRNEDFLSVFQTMLHLHGFACAERTDGGFQVLEIFRPGSRTTSDPPRDAR